LLHKPQQAGQTYDEAEEGAERKSAEEMRSECS
jgi:hypothetical protein